ncbi:MAG: hypothetical protein IKZ62_03360 [Prevotella sp.]|nr:hypothetical protein [Prevotella sp.]
MAYPVSIDYCKKIEAARHFLFSLPYKESHPENLSYEEVQHQDGVLLSSVWIENVRQEYYSQESNLIIFKGIFSDILNNSYVEDGTTRKWNESKEGLLYDKTAIIKRLEYEGNTKMQIDFYLSQVYKLQQTILERMDAARILIDWIEYPQKYEKVEWLSMFDPNRTDDKDFPIEITQIFESPCKCYEFFNPPRKLSPSGWGKRFSLYRDKATNQRGDIGTIFDKLVKLHFLEEKSKSTFEKYVS